MAGSGKWQVKWAAAAVLMAGITMGHAGQLDPRLDPSEEFFESLKVAPQPFRLVSGSGSVSGSGAVGDASGDGGERPVRLANHNVIEPKVKKYLYLLADFPDQEGAALPGEQLHALVNGTVNEWIKDFSGGRDSISGDIPVSVIRMPERLEFYQTNNVTLKLIEDALTVAAGIGIPVNNYENHVLCITNFSFPESEWIWAGLAGLNSQVIREYDPHVLVHEAIHNYGPGHASRLETNDGMVVSDDAEIIEYGSPWDVMGSGVEEYHIPNPVLLRMAGWLGEDEWVSAPTDQTVRLHSFDVSDGGHVRAMKVDGSDGAYWVGFRERDINEPGLASGPLLFKESDSTYSLLLDSQPGSEAGERDAALDLGRTFTNPDGNLFITPIGSGVDDGSGRKFMDVAVRHHPNGLSFEKPRGFVRGNMTIPARVAREFAFEPFSDAVRPGVVRWLFSDDNRAYVGDTTTRTWPASGQYTITAEANGLVGNTWTNTVEVTVIDPLDQSRSVDLKTDRTMTDAEFGDGVYVAVGERIRYSEDSTEFLEAPSGGFFMDVDYANGIFVASGQLFDFDQNLWAYGALSSVDGKIWNRHFIGGDRFADSQHRLTQVEFTGSQWITVATHGEVFGSEDGAAWALLGTMNPPFPIEQMVWAHGKLWGVNTSGVLASSPDGVTWTILRNDPKFTLTSITAQGATIVAVGADFGLISTDSGETFEEFQPLGIDRAGQLRGVGQIRPADEGFIGVHSDFISNQHFQYIASADGRHWEFVGAALGSRPRSFTAGPKGFLAVGDGGGAYFSSTSVDEGSLFSAWIAGYFEPGSVDPQDLLELADADDDGISNYREFIHGSNPADPASGPSLAFELAAGGDIIFRTDFNPMLAEVEFTILTSTDLKTWVGLDAALSDAAVVYAEGAGGKPEAFWTVHFDPVVQPVSFVRIAYQIPGPPAGQ